MDCATAAGLFPGVTWTDWRELSLNAPMPCSAPIPWAGLRQGLEEVLPMDISSEDRLPTIPVAHHACHAAAFREGGW
jgi:hypothetical protein